MENCYFHFQYRDTFEIMYHFLSAFFLGDFFWLFLKRGRGQKLNAALTKNSLRHLPNHPTPHNSIAAHLLLFD